MARLDLSVSICTCQRPNSLRKMLVDLAASEGQQTVSWEVVVIDNLPAPDTAAVVADARNSLPIRYVAESRRGVSNARNRGVAETQGKIIWFLDDDLRVPPEWLKAVLAGVQMHPDAAFFSGRILPTFVNGAPPRWLLDEPFRSEPIFGPTGKYDLGQDREGAPIDYLFGANMGFRREVLQSCDGFREDFGTAPGWLRGEEHELGTRLKDAGHKGAYVHAAAVEHIVPAYRLNTTFFLRWACQSGRASANIRLLRRKCHGRHAAPRRIRDLAVALASAIWYASIGVIAGWFSGGGRRMRIWMAAAAAFGRFLGGWDNPKLIT